MFNPMDHAELKSFIRDQRTIAAPQDSPCFPYSEHWVRSVLYLLLAGRVRSAVNGGPNRTDINRVCKQADFNQDVFWNTARFLIVGGVADEHEKCDVRTYVEGKNFQAFQSNDLKKIRALAIEAFEGILEQFTGWRRFESARDAGMVAFCAMFFTCFQGRALAIEDLSKICRAFVKLPKHVIWFLMKECGLEKLPSEDWDLWLDENGCLDLARALFAVDWAYTVRHQNKNWIYLSGAGRMLLGLAPQLPPPAPCLELKVLSNLGVLAGKDLPREVLIPLFRYCRIVRIDRVVEFRFDQKTMQEMPAMPCPSQELSKALRDAAPLPSTVTTFLEDQKQKGGRISARYCSAIIKAEDPETLQVICRHPRLKSYVIPYFPEGFLVVKPGANPDTFILRCREHGFAVSAMA